MPSLPVSLVMRDDVITDISAVCTETLATFTSCTAYEHIKETNPSPDRIKCEHTHTHTYLHVFKMHSCCKCFDTVNENEKVVLIVLQTCKNVVQFVFVVIVMSYN